MSASLLWRAPVWDPSGIAEDARLFLRGLALRGCPVALEPAVWGDLRVALSPDAAGMLDAACACQAGAPFMQVNQLIPHQFTWAAGARSRVARCLFESDRIPADWPAQLAVCDQIWVASSFNVATFAAGGVPREKLRVLPNAFDEAVFRPDGAHSPIPDRRGFVFLSAFDYNPRKGLDVLLRAWARTFSRADDVMLVLKTYSSAGRAHADIRADIDQYIRSLGCDPLSLAPIVFVPDVLTMESMAALLRAADCFVLPTHGEGWGRTLVEALACGTPVIASRWSAPLDFLHDDNAALIDGTLVDVPEIALQYNASFTGHRWFALDAMHLGELMCRTVADSAAARAKAATGCREMHARYNIGAVSEQLVALLDHISAGVTRLSKRVAPAGVPRPE